ncbi:MAG: protein kinase [Acidobacteriota bacterium]
MSEHEGPEPPPVDPGAPTQDPATTVTGPTDAKGPAEATTLLPDRVGPVRVERFLGRGGMGVVAKGYDESARRPVAVKFLGRNPTDSHGRMTGPDSDQDEDELLRVEREARLLSAMRHPHVLPILGVEEHEGRPVLVLQLAEGGSLGDRLRDGPLEPAPALRLLTQVAAALEEAHSRGIVHRDLKPDNVLLDTDDSALVADFGLACRLESSTLRSLASETIDLHDGSGAGTPGYASPEQFKGEEPDESADTWALACLAHRCLTGASVIPGDDAREQILSTLMGDVQRQPLPATIPGEVDALLDEALELEPTRRLRDMTRAREVFARAHEELTGEAVVLVGVSSAPSPSEDTPGPRLPRARSAFVGRDEELSEVLAALHAQRLVTLVGTGGAGKTRLALEAGLHLEHERDELVAHGAVFVELGVLRPTDSPVTVLAAALQLSDRPGSSTLETVREALADKAVLVILDNCEHLSGAVKELVTELLDDCPGLRFLASSREPLGHDAEHAVTLGPLGLPPAEESIEPEELLATGAIALFVDRGRLADRGFRLDASTASAVVRCCRRLDGIPLAIELAAARLRTTRVDVLADELEESLSALQGGHQAALPRHRALAATIDWSHDRLGDRERALYRRLAVLTGPFTLAFAERVGPGAELEQGEVLPTLLRLVDRSLLQSEPGGRLPTWRLLEPVRQHAGEQLTNAREETTSRSALIAATWDLARESQPRIDGGGLADCLAELDQVRALLVSAVRACLDAGDARSGLGIAAGLSGYWIARGHWREGRELLDAVLALPQDRDTAERAPSLIASGQLAMLLGDGDASRELLEDALRLLESSGPDTDAVARSDAQNSLALLALERQDLATARRRGEESLALRRTLGRPDLVANSLNLLGNTTRQEGDFEAAKRYLEEAYRIQEEEVGNDLALAAMAVNLGTVAIELEDFESGRRFLLRGGEHARACGSDRGELFVLINLAAIDHKERRLSASLGHLTKAAATCRRLSDAAAATVLFLRLGKVCTELERPEEAARFLGGAMALRIASGAERFQDQEGYEAVVTALRVDLGDDRYDTLHAEGQSQALDELLAQAAALPVTDTPS